MTNGIKNVPEMKIVYQYIKPKTKEEAEEAERRLVAAYDILFEETAKRMGGQWATKYGKEESMP